MFEGIPKFARRSTGKETEFSIKKNEDPKYRPNLSEANYGNISRVTARVEKGDRFREKSLVLKHYHGDGDRSGSRGGNNCRDKAIDAYNALKLIGVKHIPTTFRAVGNAEIVMTDFNVGDNIALAHNKIKESRSEKIESFTNLAQAIEEMRSDLMEAALYGIEIKGDAFFVVVPKQGSNIEIKIVIADLEMLWVKNFQKLTDTKQIAAVYKDNVRNLASALSHLYLSGDHFQSNNYCNSLEDATEKILLSNYELESTVRLEAAFKKEREQKAIEESRLANEQLAKDQFDIALSKIDTSVGRKLYTDVVKQKAIHMGYDKISLPKTVPGSDERISYIVCQSENGSSFGVDTLYIGYEDADHTFQIKEVAQTRWPMLETNAKIENGILRLNIETSYSDPIQISHPIDALDNIQTVSDLSEIEKSILDMYKVNQNLIDNL